MKVKINGSYIKFFDQISIARTLDSVASVFSFVGRFNPENPLHLEIYKPLAFPKVEIFRNDGTLLLTGTIVKTDTPSEAAPNLWKLSGYSKAGILERVNIPYSLYPLESLNRNLKDITSRLIAPFGIDMFVDPSVATDAAINFDKSVAAPSEKIKAYLSKLASQRNIVLSHNPSGDLVYFRPDTTAAPLYRFNTENTVSMRLSVDGDAMFSDIIVLRQPEDSESNLTPVDTVKNPLMPIYKPSVNVMTSGAETATKQAAENELAAQLTAIDLTLSFDRFVVLSPGDIVEVKNPELRLKNYQRFMVQMVQHNETTEATTTNIALVLPECFTGQNPKNIFE